MSNPSQLFEHLVTSALSALIEHQPPERVEWTTLDGEQAPEKLARHVAREVGRVLASIKGDGPERVARQVAIANGLIEHLQALSAADTLADELVALPPRLLLSLHDGQRPARTALPFSVSTLLTRAKGEPALGHELAREIATADSVDALVSFVTMGGVRAIREALLARSAASRPLRLLTTTYMGNTEAAAIAWLAQLPGVDVRISYDARRTRLHAKAWLFSRASGLDTAYVGSANLSSSALFEGHEWMLKATGADMPAVIEKFRGTFETLWCDPEFEAYDPASEADTTRLHLALADERGGRRGMTALRTFFTLKPYPFQAEILDRLAAERALHGRMRNLVVAATGTGKTVISAFDYQRSAGEGVVRPRLLFLAHREEILAQALATFRHVLRDGAFGTLLAGGAEPASHDHLFATIQSFNSRKLLERFGADHWQHVVIDECHHAPAASYQAVIAHVKPTILVGLTATPDRSDGRPLLPDFDGRIAAELRLWHALERQLLSPFEYYGVSDNVDLRGVRWARGGYRSDDLDKLYTGDDRRAELVAAQTALRVGEPLHMRALGFCVSVAHAEFMARKFTSLGIPAIAIHGDTPDDLRDQARGKLERRGVNVIFTCDLYNEGVDLPFVDTLLMLRPTASASLFLQQLGRGLRLCEGKTACLVLDFIGQHREDFRFDGMLAAVTGLPRAALRDAVEAGFPLLPTGCHLALDRVAREQVLASLRRSLRGGLGRLAEELRALEGEAIALGDFLAATGRTLDQVFDSRTSWAAIRRAGGRPVPPAGPEEALLAPKLRQLLHLDEPARLAFYTGWLAALPVQGLSETERRWVLMLAYQLFHERDRRYTVESFAALLAAHPAIVADLRALVAVLLDEAFVRGGDAGGALTVHARYGRREVLTALGRWNEEAKPDSREGVVRLEAEQTELLFVTLDKGEKRFSPTTSYHDYAIGETRFHWQTQSLVSPTSPSGRRYVAQAANGWKYLLFVRETVNDVYTYLGPVRYAGHTGSKPMNITWELESAIPGRWLTAYALLAS